MNPSNQALFGPIRLDLKAGELLLDGRRIRLHEQPFQILKALLENPGEVVTREDIRRRLWPSGTVVEFDHSINVAIQKLRQALGDSAERPRYVETVARRGYRWMVPVEWEEVRPNKAQPGWSQLRKAAAVLILTGTIGCLVGVWRYASGSLPRLRQRQLTVNFADDGVVDAAISRDGKYLAYFDRRGIYVKLLETGEVKELPRPEELGGKLIPGGSWEIDWFPGSTRFAASARLDGHCTLWEFSLLGGAARKLRDDACLQAISPDGQRVAFLTKRGDLGNHEIWLMRASGEPAQKWHDAGENGAFESVEWSPDGQRLAYQRVYRNAGAMERVLETRNLSGSAPTTITPPGPASFRWMADGRMIFSVDGPRTSGLGCNFFETRVDPRSGLATATAKQLTNWAGFCMDNLSSTSDGKLAYHRWSNRGNVLVADIAADGSIVTPHQLTLTDGHNIAVAWTPDSRSVVFLSDRNGGWGIFQQTLDSATALPLVAGLTQGEQRIEAAVSPDGQWLIYLESPRVDGTSQQVMRVPIQGGPPQRLLTVRTGARFACTKSPVKLCLLSEKTSEGTQFSFAHFDVGGGRGNEIMKIAIEAGREYLWDLSPDGKSIAFVQHPATSSGVVTGPIRIFSLVNKPSIEIQPSGWRSAESLKWSADGRALLVSTHLHGEPALVRVKLNGEARPLWYPGGGDAEQTVGVPSPDGRHIAMLGWNENGNIWMIDGF